jgi:hypothetical protein
VGHPRPLDLRGTVLALILAAIWSANPLAVKVGLADAPPFRLAWMRFLLGGLAILAYAWWTRHRGVFDVHPGEWRVLWSLGLLFAVQIGLMNVGIARTTATHAAVLVNSYAVHTVVLAHFFIPGDRLTVPKLGGIAVAYLGAIKEANGAAMSIGRISTFIDIFIERDLQEGTLDEAGAQEIWDQLVQKLRIVRFLRTADYDARLSGDPYWATECVGGVDLGGRSSAVLFVLRVEASRLYPAGLSCTGVDHRR